MYSEKIKRINELISLLNSYRDSYYNENCSNISDSEYDRLFDELKNLEEETGIVYSNSPTQSVGYEVKSELTKVKHTHPMLSLDKTKDVSELVKFINNQDYVLSLKMDGLTVLLTYDDGILVKAETRGNGEIGEDITHNAKMFENIPLTIPYKEYFEIEGEAIITYKDFEKINSKLSETDKYKNPRNLVSGSVRQLDSSICKERHVKFIAWKIPNGFKNITDSFDFAEKIGFEIVPYIATNDIEHIDFLIKDRKEVAEKNSFPVDGLVCVYNDIEYGKSLGMTSHHPKHSIAFKFEDEEYETKLIDIEWQVGKSGQITPVAVFEPTEIDGSIIEKASVHNISILSDLELQIGDIITIYKANMVIPQIKENLSANERKHNELPSYMKLPSYCPICEFPTKIKKDNNSEVLICTNPNCKGKLLGKLKHFVSKDAMNIIGLSEATLEFLINKGWITSFEDIYTIYNYEGIILEWKNINGFGDKSVDKIIESIINSKNVTLDSLINALSIPNVGKSTAKDIAKYCNYDLEEFKRYMNCPEIFSNINGIGDIVVDSLNKWFDDDWISFLELCKHLDVIKPNLNKNTINLNNKIFVITGSLNHFKNRDELVKIIENNGGKVSGSVSAKTSCLINNDKESNSSKNKKAKELNIPILSEEDFLNILNK